MHFIVSLKIWADREPLVFQGANDAFQETRSVHRSRQSVRSISGRLVQAVQHGRVFFLQLWIHSEKKIFVRAEIRRPCRDHYFSSNPKPRCDWRGGITVKEKRLRRARAPLALSRVWVAVWCFHAKCLSLWFQNQKKKNSDNLDFFFFHWVVIAAYFVFFFFGIGFVIPQPDCIVDNVTAYMVTSVISINEMWICGLNVSNSSFPTGLQSISDVSVTGQPRGRSAQLNVRLFHVPCTFNSAGFMLPTPFFTGNRRVKTSLISSAELKCKCIAATHCSPEQLQVAFLHKACYTHILNWRRRSVGSGFGVWKLWSFLYSTQLKRNMSVESLLPLLSSLSWRTLRLFSFLCSANTLSLWGIWLRFSFFLNQISAWTSHVPSYLTQNVFLLYAFVDCYSKK